MHNPMENNQSCAHKAEKRPGLRARIAVFYPWSDLENAFSGASRRVGLLLDFLAERGHHVVVLQSGSRSFRRPSGVEILGHDTKRAPIWLRAAIKLACLVSAEEYITYIQILKFFEPYFDNKLETEIARLVEWSDVVILEYPFYSMAVAKNNPDCKRVVLTAHDLMFEQSKGRLSRYALKYLEMRSFKRASSVVTVSQSENEELLSAGIPAFLARHPFRPSVRSVLPFSRGHMTEELSIDTTKRLCLFVGGDYYPNVEAARHVSSLAEIFLALGILPDVLFLVVGRCSPVIRTENFQAAGVVSEEMLQSLYKHAAAVIIPLTSGTGSSVKTIEAFGHGKAVVGTKLAFRGLEVQSNHNCIIVRDMQSFPSELAAALQEPGSLARMGVEALKFSREFEYTRVLQIYTDLLEL